MRWCKPESGLKVGQTRQRLVFAWFPTIMVDGTRVWLEKYARHERVARFKQVFFEGELYYDLMNDMDVTPPFRLRWIWLKNEMV